MIEMADHIGAYNTLLLVNSFGGEDVYFPIGKNHPGVAQIVGEAVAAKLSWVYGLERYTFPKAQFALDRARRASIIAAARSGMLTRRDAGRIMGTSRTYAACLINQSDEGVDVEPFDIDAWNARKQVASAILSLTIRMAEVGVPASTMEAIRAAIISAVDKVDDETIDYPGLVSADPALPGFMLSDATPPPPVQLDDGEDDDQ